jgi:hypothetical protein
MRNAASEAFRREIDQYTDDIPFWDPAPGDSIIGTLISVDPRTTQFATEVPVLTIRSDDGKLTEVWASHTVLRSELKKLKPKVGRPLAIKRLADPAPPAKYRRYKVFLEASDQPEFSWDDVPEEGSDVPADSNVLALRERAPKPTTDPLASGDDDLPF